MTKEPTLFPVNPSLPPDGKRDGETYQHEFDYERLNKQQKAVFKVIQNERWHTLRYISAQTGYPEASISARLRDLRKPRFGGLTVERRRHPRVPGLWEYRLQLEKSS